ncbi:MAG: cobalt ABC transporter [Chlorobiaceae bacterium]|nr:cobalt ABC transporter [Chlorobiaceae bacterium]
MREFEIRSATGTTTAYPLPVSDSTAILLLALYIVTVVSVPKYDLPGVIAFGAFPVLLATATRMPLPPLLKRLAAASPFILFMAGGNMLLDRSPVATVAGITISGGMLSAAVITMKALATLSSLLSLMSLMPFHRFGMALRSLAVPEVFVTQLLLVYRYSFLLSHEAAMMQKARDLRSFGKKGRGADITMGLIGSLLLRTASRAERIYMAMSSRGFRSALSTRPPVRISSIDLLIVAGSALLFLAIRLIF